MVDPLHVFVAVWLALLGLVIGSFLNVVIGRLPAGESIVRPRSRCPKCGHQLSWYENIPVFSWLALRAKCRSCKAPISVRYPAVELLTAVLFLLMLWRFGWTWELAMGLMLVVIVVPLALIDAEHWILPEELTLPGIALGVLMSIPLGWERVRGALLGVVFGFLAFRLMEYLGWKLFKKEALGGGDKFLLALLGGFLTHHALIAIILLASLQGAIFGILSLLVTGRAGPEMPAGEGADTPTDGEAEEAPLTMSWDFLAPGVPWWKRLLILPMSLLWQPIPDEPVDAEGEVEEWQPGATNLPFGPWLVIAGLEFALLGPWLARVLPLGLDWLFGAPL
ncbi:MAG TPA: prepilin peptidase [Myxococcaceae bacterium]|nr:prepilin peptidase [Myxococcaceae bacterium]